jgi:hypothetical protein
VTFAYRDYRLFEPQPPPSLPLAAATPASFSSPDLKVHELLNRLANQDRVQAWQSGMIQALRDELSGAKQELAAKIAEVALLSQPKPHEDDLLLDAPMPYQMARDTVREAVLAFDPLAPSDSAAPAPDDTISVPDLSMRDVDSLLAEL